MVALRRPLALTAAAALLLAATQAEARRRGLQQSAGLANENGFTSTTYQGDNGAIYGDGQLQNVCAFKKGSINIDHGAILLGLGAKEAQFHVKIAGRGSFIAPPEGVLTYGPSCLLYDTVCNYVYQEPCNSHGTCQTNNTCLCNNAYRSCRPNSGSVTGASAGCETRTDNDPNNCGGCNVVCLADAPYCVDSLCSTSASNNTNVDNSTVSGRRRLEEAIAQVDLQYDEEFGDLPGATDPTL